MAVFKHLLKNPAEIDQIARPMLVARQLRERQKVGEQLSHPLSAFGNESDAC